MQFNLPDYFLPDLVVTVAFGIVAIFLILLGYIVFDKLTPKLDFDELLNKGNVALAIVIGTFLLGLCYVVGRVVSAILGAGV
jgi:putative membrane protein